MSHIIASPEHAEKLKIDTASCKPFHQHYSI